MGKKAGAILSRMRKDKKFICFVCGVNFISKDSRAKFCSNRCKQKEQYARRKSKQKGVHDKNT